MACPAWCASTTGMTCAPDSELCCREYYGLEHLHRVRRFASNVPYDGGKGGLCTRLHVQPCSACVSCHFCRHVLTNTTAHQHRSRLTSRLSATVLCAATMVLI